MQLFACVSAQTAGYIESWSQKVQVWELRKVNPLLSNRTSTICAMGV